MVFDLEEIMNLAIDNIEKLNLANFVGKVMDEIMENYQSLSIILSFTLTS